MTAEEVRALLGLEANATCGFVRETWRSVLSIAPGGLASPFADGRPLGSALYFLVSPAAPVKLHRIRNHQLYHYYLGDPLEVLLLHEDGEAERVIVGPDLRAGQRVQLLIPGWTFHTARLGRRAALVPRRQHGMARRGSRRCRAWRSRRRWRRVIRKSPPTSAASRDPCDA